MARRSARISTREVKPEGDTVEGIATNPEVEPTEQLSEQTEPGDKDLKKDFKKDPKPYVCDVCGHRAAIPSRLKEHQWAHTKPFKCPESTCDYTTSRPYLLKQHAVRHDPDPLARKPYACPYPRCNYRTAHAQQFIIHKEHIHEKNGPTKIKCPDCTRIFNYKTSLESHQKVHRFKYDKRLKCPQCPYSTNRSQHYRQHTVKHNEERPFACKFCPHRSKWEQNVKKHEKMFHSGIPRVKKPRKPRPKRDPATIEPWRCSFPGCNYKTKHSRRDLMAHEQIHNMNRERTHECPHCGNRFYRAAHVGRHVQICLKNPNAISIRRRYKCSKCSYSSRDSWFVKYHMAVHKDERPFKCPIKGCNYRSKWSKSLPYHMTIHNETQPYACSIPGCSFRSKWAKNIPVHENRTHKALVQTRMRKFEFIDPLDEEDQIYIPNGIQDFNSELFDLQPEDAMDDLNRSTPRRITRSYSRRMNLDISTAISQSSGTNPEDVYNSDESTDIPTPQTSPASHNEEDDPGIIQVKSEPVTQSTTDPSTSDITEDTPTECTDSSELTSDDLSCKFCDFAAKNGRALLRHSKLQHKGPSVKLFRL